jgi:hypothetical protein
MSFAISDWAAERSPASSSEAGRNWTAAPFPRRPRRSLVDGDSPVSSTLDVTDRVYDGRAYVPHDKGLGLSPFGSDVSATPLPDF